MESVFDQLRNLPLTIFAVTMDQPTQVIPRQTIHLPSQYRYILQRVNTLVLDEPAMAVVLVDGDGSQYGGLSRKFEQYLNRHYEGQSMTKVVDTPYFVDSQFTTGVQLADLIAGVIRHTKRQSYSAGLLQTRTLLLSLGITGSSLQRQGICLTQQAGFQGMASTECRSISTTLRRKRKGNWKKKKRCLINQSARCNARRASLLALYLVYIRVI